MNSNTYKDKYNDDNNDVAMIMMTTTKTNGEGDNIISGLFWRSFGLIVQIHVQPSRI